MPGRLAFEFGVKGDDRGIRKDDTPFSLLLLGDFGAAGADEATTAIIRLTDVDNVDELWHRFEPRLPVDPDHPGELFAPRELEDFHPDQLLNTLADFRELRDWKARLTDPATADEALTQLLKSTSMTAETDARAETTPTEDDKESADDMFSRLLGDRPSGPSRQKPANGGVDALLRSAVAPHLAAEPDPRVDTAIRTIDQAIARRMRQILHSPGFRSLEANWRSLYRLVQEAETDETLEIHVCNITRDALLEALPDSGADLANSGLYRLLAERHRAATDGRAPSMIALNHEFGTSPDDVALLASLGAIAESMNACVLAGASPATVGAESVADLGDHRRWLAATELNDVWRAFREMTIARSVGLVLPRLLGRLPYGEDTDPVDAFGFEEIDDPGPASFLWTSPVPAVCACLLEQFSLQGWSMRPGGPLNIEELPAFSYTDDGETKMRPCTEQLMPEAAVDAALERGIMPLAGYRNQDRARLVRLQSMASPLTALRGPWAG